MAGCDGCVAKQLGCRLYTPSRCSHSMLSVVGLAGTFIPKIMVVLAIVEVSMDQIQPTTLTSTFDRRVNALEA